MDTFKYVILIMAVMALRLSVPSNASAKQSFSCPAQFPEEFFCTNVDPEQSESGFINILVCGESQSVKGPEDIVLIIQDKTGTAKQYSLESFHNIGSSCYLHYLGTLNPAHQDMGFVACYFGSQAWLAYSSSCNSAQTESFECRKTCTSM